MTEHWFDRWAAPQTRRGVLRSALVAAATLTVPFVRAGGARAAGPHDCQKGCLWTAEQTAQAAWDACTVQAQKSVKVGALLTIWGAGLLYVDLTAFTAYVGAAACHDQTVIAHKADNWNCVQPDCPGFDPSAPGGPCEPCAASGGNCCPCQATATGYICCSYPCNDPSHSCCPGG